MIIVHHLNNSRSQRILWLLEELGLEYEIKPYQRDKQTMLAPPELRAVHPLGKSPVVSVDGLTLAESGAIIEYPSDRYGAGKLAPAPNTPERFPYLYWLHFAEGSAIHLDYMEGELAKTEWFAGNTFTSADIQMSFAVEASRLRAGLDESRPKLMAWLRKIHERPAYKRALERGGKYDFAKD